MKTIQLITILSMITLFSCSSTPMVKKDPNQVLYGTWTSVFVFQGNSYDLTYRFSKSNENALKISFDNPGLNMMNIEIQDPKFDGKELTYKDHIFQMNVIGELVDSDTMVIKIYRDQQYYTTYTLHKKA